MSEQFSARANLWLLVGRELFERGYITEDVLVWGAIEEPKMKWLLLEKEEWDKFISMRDLRNPNPIEHSGETEQELAEIEMAFNIFVKETIKNFPESENFFRTAGLMDFDNVIFMSAERTEKKYREADEAQIRYFGKEQYYNLDCLRLAFFIHELIHTYEYRLSKVIIEDTMFTEGLLQIEILFSYLRAHNLHPKNFKLSYVQETT